VAKGYARTTYGSNNMKELLNLNKYWEVFNGTYKSFLKKCKILFTFNYRWVVIQLFYTARYSEDGPYSVKNSTNQESINM
jgi:hypothetical protein